MIAFRLLAAALAAPLLAACVSLTEKPRALIYDSTNVSVKLLECAAAVEAARAFVPPAAAAGAIDPAEVRVLTWNIHKEGDRGWDRDLAGFAAENDILLLQEVVLKDQLDTILRGAGLRWVMASSFTYEDFDIGVLTATRAVPVANCTQRFNEPLLQIPKSAVITWLRIPGWRDTLAVANVHAINFTIPLGTYREQLAAVGDALAQHDGPIVFGGDLNTWTDERVAAVRELAARLRLTEIEYSEDKRTLFFGQQLDHLFVRGLELASSRTIPVTSSDHNPVGAVFRIPRSAPKR